MSFVLFFIGFLVLVCYLKLRRVGSREHGLPPGPPTLPVVGNMHLIPKNFAHYKFTEWARCYGDIYSLKIGPQTAIVISSASTIRELIDRRSSTTSSRPHNAMTFAIAHGNDMTSSAYTELWRNLRRVSHSVITPHALEKHQPIQKAEAVQLMYDILKSPEKFYNDIRRYSNSLILSIIYGIRAPRFESPLTTKIFQAMHLWEQAIEPNAHPPIDLIPLLNLIPERLAPWKQLCSEARELSRKIFFDLLKQCEDRLSRGEANGCYMEEVIQRQEEFGLKRDHVGYFGFTLTGGGSDTTAAFLHTLLRALIAWPEVLRKAQDEIDRVIGNDRLPSADDIQDLPYIQAVIKETHRYRPIGPLAIPHSTVVTQEYRGFVIPQGSAIFMNIWAIFQDPEVFEDPEIFEPERFLKTEHGTKPGVDDSDYRASMAFGGGRRICPGIHLANSSIIINILNLLWAFNWSTVIDPESKKPVPVDTSDFYTGAFTLPRPFKCDIVPRTKRRAELIEKEFFESAVGVFESFEHELCDEDKEWIRVARKR